MSATFDEQQQFVDSGGQPIVNGFIYIGDQGTDPTILANRKDIFSTRDLNPSNALANPQRTDANGRSVNKIWTDGRYSMRISDLNDTQLYQELDNGEDAGTVTLALGNVIGSNAITADASPTITSLDDKAQFIFKVVSENTTDAITLNIDGLGAKDIKRNFDQVVGVGKFKVNQIVIVAYNSTTDDFEWVNENARINTETKGADIASAATVDLLTATGNNLNITGHDGPITALGTVIAGVVYRLTFEGSAPVTITSSSIANPTNILCAAAHSLTTGDEVIIEGHTESVPDINRRHTVTVIDTTNYTIPVNVTTGGTGGTSTGVPKITHNATSMILLDGKDLELRPGDMLPVQSLGSGNFRQIGLVRADGGVGVISTQAEARAGIQNTRPSTSLRVAEAIDGYGGRPEVFTADGTYNIPEGVSSVLVEAIGGGGGGGGTGSSNGDDGTDTTFGSLVTGGLGHFGLGVGSGGNGGTTSTTGTLIKTGQIEGAATGAGASGGQPVLMGSTQLLTTGSLGAGGGGTGGGGGGGSGGFIQAVVAVTSGGSETVTIGTGGNAGAGAGPGLDGYVVVTPLI